LAKVVREDAMMVVPRLGNCILLGEHSRVEMVEEGLLTETNQGRPV
jgi:hypothetical protein